MTKRGLRRKERLAIERVFTVPWKGTKLAKPWAGQAARLAFAGMPENVAVIVADWKKFGKLPVPQWGMAVCKLKN